MFNQNIVIDISNVPVLFKMHEQLEYLGGGILLSDIVKWVIKEVQLGKGLSRLPVQLDYWDDYVLAAHIDNTSMIQARRLLKSMSICLYEVISFQFNMLPVKPKRISPIQHTQNEKLYIFHPIAPETVPVMSVIPNEALEQLDKRGDLFRLIELTNHELDLPHLYRDTVHPDIEAGTMYLYDEFVTPLKQDPNVNYIEADFLDGLLILKAK